MDPGQKSFPGGAMHHGSPIHDGGSMHDRGSIHDGGAPLEPRPSILFPIVRHWRELGAKAKWARFAGVILVGFLLMLVTQPAEQASPGMIALGFAIVVGTCEIFYRLCGRPIPAGVRMGYIAAATVYTLTCAPAIVVLEQILIASGVDSALTAGLVEELAKFGIVALIFAVGSAIAKSKPGTVVGVREPLEGIFVGVTAGAVFAFIEALLYVPQEGTSAVLTRTLAISPGLHAACAGLMGYFFGLSRLMPKHRWTMPAVGYATATGIHTCWDLIANAGTPLVLLPFAILNYGLLGAAILKSRKISPTRSVNFATEVLKSPVLKPPVLKPAAAPVNAAPIRPAVQPIPQPPRAAAPMLRLPGRSILLSDGLELLATEIPGLQASGPEAAIATVERQDAHSDVLGLCNRSGQSWVVTSQKGTRPLAPGQAIKVRNGVIIDFGAIRGEFQV